MPAHHYAEGHRTVIAHHPREDGDRRPYIALCSCGWRSSRRPTEVQADTDATAHVLGALGAEERRNHLRAGA